MSNLNIDLFKRVRDKIASTPEAYDQATFGRESTLAPCGTAACIAGWACVLSGTYSTEELRSAYYDGELFRDIDVRAAELLGLKADEAEMLFTGEPEGDVVDEYTRDGGWPEPFAEQWECAITHAERAAVAVAYLNHIIETGEVF